MPFENNQAEHLQRIRKAQAMGGPEKLDLLHREGRLNARERVTYLVDAETFHETGLFATSIRPEMRDKTPADGKVAGFAQINGRPIGLIANDFTVLGASSSAVNSKKVHHVKEIATRKGMPLVFLGESTGARMPDVMGAAGMGQSQNPTQYRRTRESPWASAVLGFAFGSAAWYACMSDFTVMRKGSVMAVSSPRLVAMATKERIDPEELGGWRLHSQVTGLVDMAVDTDEEALDAIKTFLSYLPSHHNEIPPKHPVPANADQAVQGILDILPENRQQVYDVRKIIQAVVDPGSVFELKSRYGRTIVTALARIDGRVVGIVANNPLVKGGAIDANGAAKATEFLVLCDSFNMPIILFQDQPGFLVGLEAERQGMPGKVINWMNALSLCTVPKIAVILRKSYGQAFLNMGGGGNADELAAWWSAEISFMDPVAATVIVTGLIPAQDPQRFDQAFQSVQKETSPYESAAVYGVQDVIDPRDTRDYLKTMLNVHDLRLTNGVGQHDLSTWPTSF